MRRGPVRPSPPSARELSIAWMLHKAHCPSGPPPDMKVREGAGTGCIQAPIPAAPGLQARVLQPSRTAGIGRLGIRTSEPAPATHRDRPTGHRPSHAPLVHLAGNNIAQRACAANAQPTRAHLGRPAVAPSRRASCSPQSPGRSPHAATLRHVGGMCYPTHKSRLGARRPSQTNHLRWRRVVDAQLEAGDGSSVRAASALHTKRVLPTGGQ